MSEFEVVSVGVPGWIDGMGVDERGGLGHGNGVL